MDSVSGTSPLPTRNGTTFHQPQLILAVLASLLIHLLFMLIPAGQDGMENHQGTQSEAKRASWSVKFETQTPSGATAASPPHGEAVSATSTQENDKKAPEEEDTSVISVDGYLASESLDQKPEMVDGLPIDPPELRSHPEGGTLIMTLLINDAGFVDRALLEKSTLPAPFVEATQRGMALVRFIPGIKNGRPVKSRIRLEIHYRDMNPSNTTRIERGQELAAPPSSLRPVPEAAGN